MNKTAIKNFAIWARNKLIADITYKAGLLGITEKEIKNPLPQSTKDVQFFDIGTKKPYSITGSEIEQRRKLTEAMQLKAKQSDYMTAYKSVIEEVAYTWFNRLIAVRFMEVNDYLPNRIRVLSSESSSKIEPDLLTSPFDADLDYTPYEKDRIMQLKNNNQLDELFRVLFIKQCNTLNAILPELFEKTNDYTELLMNVSFTDKDGVVYRLVNDIPEDDFNVAKKGQVEIIGWLYQYYNTEPKQAIFDGLKKNIKITKENIPAATQLFTPDWIVRYMVENSLGRLWLERERASSGLSDEYLNASYFGWKYYLEEAEQEPEVEAQLEKIRKEYKDIKPEDIKIIDPCMGSGHILVYAFDVLIQIYESCGYSQRDAAKLILEKNLYGLEIDRRAYQLAYFALMMKARQYNRRILTFGVRPQVYEPTGYADGMEYGSLVRVDKLEPMPEQPKDQLTLFDDSYDVKLNAWNFRRLLSTKYDVVVTNPPYMGNRGMGAKLIDYIVAKYADSKSDLFATFIEQCVSFTALNGYTAMITQHSWMFLSSYEKLRAKLIKKDIVNMAHLGAKAFEEIGGEVVQTTAFVLRNSDMLKYKATYSRLVKFQSQREKEEAFLQRNNIYIATKDNFTRIIGTPITAYWLADPVFNTFSSGNNIGSLAEIVSGMTTGDNEKYLRLWFEPIFTSVALNKKSLGEVDLNMTKWIPYNKGGEQRKWYGNNEYVVNWSESGNFNRAKTTMTHLYLKPCITWSDISGTNFAGRYCFGGFMFDVKGSAGFGSEENLLYLIAVLNTKITPVFIEIFNPSTTTQVGDLRRIPLIYGKTKKETDLLVKNNVELSRTDWDSFETSWDFTRHPLICGERTVESAFTRWKREASERFITLKANEEELNCIFIDIYGLQDELDATVEDKHVTVRQADLGREIRSLISYAVGCMFGRYSLDVEGLAYAGGEWDDSKYSTFIPDTDNVLPITDEEYFEDDVVGLFCTFFKKSFGEETLEENLDYIAKALGNKGNSSRETIRNYFLKEFFKDHCKIYQKRPIYWLFDSGKADGFKALVYMHRYNEDTIGNLRIDYLHRMQRVYESEIIRMQEIINNSSNGREVTTATKRKEKLIKQLKEAKEYDEKIAHLALSRIAIDLDDGVKFNYEKVQTGVDGKKLEVLAKI